MLQTAPATGVLDGDSTLTLTAGDFESGVYATYYRLAGATHTYDGPFHLPGHTGPTPFAYWSVDYAVGSDQYRFYADVRKDGAQVFGYKKVTEVPGGHQLRVAVTVEVENSPKPAVAAECLFRHYA